MRFGEKLRITRKEKGMTQAELAKRSGLSLRTIISYEKGETYPQKVENYLALSSVLGVPGSYLLAEDIDGDDGSASATSRNMAVNRYGAKVGAYLLGGLPDHIAYTAAMTGLAEELYCEMSGEALPYEEISSQPVTLTIHAAQQRDFPMILSVWANQRALDSGLPPIDLNRLGKRIEERSLFVIKANDQVCATFALRFDAAEVYTLIEGGWNDTLVFGWLEDFASDGKQMGVYSACLNFCVACCPNLRTMVKTESLPLTKTLEAHGFLCCGKSADKNGTNLLAYERSQENG